MTFTPSRLLNALAGLPKTSHYWVAYSGGLDSHALLHGLATLRDKLSAEIHAVYVDHGLQAESADWAVHCAAVCKSLDIPLQILELHLKPEKGESLEAQARQARYQAIESLMAEDDILLTAHHQDDQAETLLLQLLRGAGPAGLAAMPAVAGFGKGLHARPLLGFSRKALSLYGAEHQLTWVEDKSNNDPSYDRNYLRHKVIPLIEERWPSMGRTLSRSARHLGESQSLIDELAREELKGLTGDEPDTLSIPGLLALIPARTRAVLRFWIREAGFPLPDTARLNRILDEVVTARADRNPVVNWQGAEVRRYRNYLYLMTPLSELNRATVLTWDLKDPLVLPSGLGQLRFERGAIGIASDLIEGKSVEVRFQHSEKCLQISGHSHSTTFKNFFQQNAIPPWRRSRLPLIFINGELAAVADLCVAASFQGKPGQSCIGLRWEQK